MPGPTIVEVDQGDITCPICCKTIVNEDGPGTQPSCAHVRFIYVNDDGFEYIDPELQNELNAERASAEKRGERFDTWDALRAHTGPDSIILDQTETGMACGPIPFTVWVGIRKNRSTANKRLSAIGMFDEVNIVTPDEPERTRRRAAVKYSSPRISKSKFMAGVQCLKRLYGQVHEPEMGAAPDASAVAILEQGKDVGRLAHLLFPGGVEVDAENLGEAIRITNELIANPAVPAIFEATFSHGGVLVRVDILERRGKKEWRLFEVKSTADLKDSHLYDVGIQSRVVSSSGIKLSSANLVHLNRDYVLEGGALDLKKLFRVRNLNRRLGKFQKQLTKQLRTEFRILRQPAMPDIAPGRHCRKPVVCEFYDLCNPWFPSDSVYSLPRADAETLEQLKARGMEEIRDIPEDFPLSALQHKARITAVSGKPWCSPDLHKNLEALQYPICFMDFETIRPAVPRLAGMRPFMHVPFQWSVHRQATPGAELEHFEFLADDATDPRLAFLKSLLPVVDGAATILVYNQKFESGRLSELAAAFPRHSETITKIQSKLWDLLPFMRDNIYHLEFRGSFSLKSVLPALIPDMSYDSLAVADGGEASIAFEKMINPESDDVMRAKLRNSLLEYCAQDTLAMVRLLEVLRTLPDRSPRSKESNPHIKVNSVSSGF